MVWLKRYFFYMSDIICGIYKITCSQNQKIYIGSSSNIKTRWHRHRSNFKNNCGNPNMLNSYKKYGIDSFVFEILEKCEIDELIKKETYWAEKYKSEGYILFNCGEFIDNPNRGIKYGEDVRAKISKSLLGNTHTKGHKVKEETKAKISASLKKLGRKLSKENIEKLREAAKKPKSEEAKLKMSKIRIEMKGIKVLCIDTNETFNSYKEAAEKFKTDYQGIRQSILRNGKCHGLTFKHINI